MITLRTEELRAQLAQIRKPRLTRRQFDNIVAVLCAAYEDFDPGPKQQDKWFERLRVLPGEDCYVTILQWIAADRPKTAITFADLEFDVKARNFVATML